MNPTDAYRKELRKKELKSNKKERKKVREVGILKKDPDTLKEQIDKLEAMKADGALDKARKHKKRQLEDTLNLVMKKRKEYEVKVREKGEEPVILTTAEEEERVKHQKPEDSVYYHTTLNLTGAPPPGKPPMFKSSIGPRIPLSAASLSGVVSSSLSELEDVALSVPPPPPPPPPPLLPHVSEVDSGDISTIPASLPLPPPPPKPPKPALADLGTNLPPPPLPPPPPGPPPKEQAAMQPSLPPRPPLHKLPQPPPPGTGRLEREKSQSAQSDNLTSQEPIQGSSMLPPPPPPPGLPQKLAINHSESASSNSDTNNQSEMKELPKMIPPPTPPRQQPPVPGPPLLPSLHADGLPPGISRFPPPPPSMLRQLSAPGISWQPAPPGMMIPLIPRPPYGPPPGPPLMMRPPLLPGPPHVALDDPGVRPFVPQKPSYVKSAASSVVKRPLAQAQHTPQLTSMVPASVRVRRESAVPKAKPKPSLSSSSVAATTLPTAAPTVEKQESVNSSSAPSPQSIDDSYMAFLEDMKALGSLDS